MSSRLPATLFLGAALSFAQGTTPKPAPSDYDVHLSAGTLDLGSITLGDPLARLIGLAAPEAVEN